MMFFSFSIKKNVKIDINFTTKCFSFSIKKNVKIDINFTTKYLETVTTKGVISTTSIVYNKVS